MQFFLKLKGLNLRTVDKIDVLPLLLTINNDYSPDFMLDPTQSHFLRQIRMRVSASSIDSRCESYFTHAPDDD